MKSEVTLYTLKCHECQKIFRTDKPHQHFCPDCLKFRQPNKPYRKKKAPKKVPKKVLTVAEILHIAEVYNKVNHKYLHYGEIVALVDKNVDRCVCCGEIVPEGRQVCPICEGSVK